MRISVFDTHRFERTYLESAFRDSAHELNFVEARLTEATAKLANQAEVACAFVNDCLNERALSVLAEGGTRLIALRSAGFNHVDLAAAKRLGMRIVRVPEYSPYAVAEHAVALILALNRKIHRSHARVREGNFSLDGLVGFDLHGSTVGIIGTGKIGSIMARIMAGFGCRLLGYDVHPDARLCIELGLKYVGIEELYRSAKIISLHVPLTPGTRHIVNRDSIGRMNHGVMLINTGRGALVDTRALIEGLKAGRIAYAGLDVYEEEEGFFFQDLSEQVIQDDVLARLLTFPNVIVTSHQAFLTHEALNEIARTTRGSVDEFAQGMPLSNEVRVDEA